MNVGKRIKKRRKELGLSVDAMAENIGKNRATIYRYESEDIENLPISILEPLARVLKTTPAYLMGWEENPSALCVCEESNYTSKPLLNNNVVLDYFTNNHFNQNEINDIIKYCEFVKSQR